MDNPNLRTRATIALIALLLFPAVVLVLNVVQSGYSALSQAMSELALGSAGWLMGVAFVSMGIGTALVGLCIRDSIPRARVAPIALVLAGTLDVVSAFFHTNGDEPATTASTIHEIAGISTFILVVIAMYATIGSFRRRADWRSFVIPTAVWSIVATGTFFLVPILGDDLFGLAQRIFVATWISWLAVVAARTRALAARPSVAPEPIRTAG